MIRVVFLDRTKRVRIDVIDVAVLDVNVWIVETINDFDYLVFCGCVGHVYYYTIFCFLTRADQSPAPAGICSNQLALTRAGSRLKLTQSIRLSKRLGNLSLVLPRL